MPSLSEKDQANIAAGIDAIQKIQLFVVQIEDADQFYENQLVFDASLMNFVLIGEVISKVSSDTQIQYPHIPWRLVKDFRNMIAHNYFGVDAEEVWEIIQKHLPQLLIDLKIISKHL